MRFERLDPVARTAEIVASGQDVRGKGGADMRMTSSLVERAPGETEVTITSQVNVMGILAQFGRGMIEDLSDQMFGKFVTAARAELEQPESQAPIAGSAKSRPDAASCRRSPGDAGATRRAGSSRSGAGRRALAGFGGRRPCGRSQRSTLDCRCRHPLRIGLVLVQVAAHALREDFTHDSRVLRLPRSVFARRRHRAPAATRRSGQGAVRRPEPAAAAQAPPWRRRAPRGHRPHPRPRVHQGGRRLPQDRWAHARVDARALRTHQVEVPDPVRHRPRDRGSAGAQPRHRRRQPRACRSSQRPSRHDARARRRGSSDRRPGRANHPYRGFFHGHLQYGARAG